MNNTATATAIGAICRLSLSYSNELNNDEKAAIADLVKYVLLQKAAK
jgi:hypothetical protein